MKHIIFSDIDGTIYPRSKEIHPENITEIKKAQDEGIEFVICTGNGYFENVANLTTRLNARYAITSNGASIFDRELNDFIFKAMIDKDIANEILKFSIENKTGSNFWDDEFLYINKYTDQRVIDVMKSVMILDKEPIVRDSITRDIFKIEFYDEKHKIDAMVEFLKKFNLQIARMKDNHVEVTNNNVSKGDGIKWLCQNNNWNISKTMGIGDSANDLPMFEVVEYSYAMGNGSDQVKNLADYTVESVELGGLAEGIKHFKRIIRNAK